MVKNTHSCRQPFRFTVLFFSYRDSLEPQLLADGLGQALDCALWDRGGPREEGDKARGPRLDLGHVLYPREDVLLVEKGLGLETKSTLCSEDMRVAIVRTHVIFSFIHEGPYVLR